MRLVLLAIFPALAGVGWSQIDVPGDYPDPQTAVDNANPGDVIVIHGGTWTSVAPNPALVIDKPLTLIGDPAPTFEPPLTGSGQQPATVLLAGPGSGEVVLARLNIGGLTAGFAWGSQSGGLAGGGFSEVHVYDSTIAAPTWVALTGVADGSSGIDVTTPYLLLSSSAVRASDGADDGCYGVAYDGHAGVRCTGTVVALDSIIDGGSYRQPCFITPGCAPITSGDGGPGVESARLDEAGSSISGGPGAVWTDALGAPCGSAPAGPSFVAATHVALADDLSATSLPSLGSSFTLSWNTPGPVIQIYYSRGPSPPFLILPGFPEAYLDPTRVRFLGTFPSGGGVQSIQIPVPALTFLIGLELSFQAVDPPATVTRPVSVIVGP